MRPSHWEPRHHERCCHLPSRVRGAAEPLPWLPSPICGAQLSRPFRRKSHARRLAICIPFILPYLTSAGLWRSSAEGNDDDTAMSSVRDVLPALTSTTLSSCGGDNLLRDGRGPTCLGRTDARRGFSCHRAGNGGY